MNNLHNLPGFAYAYEQLSVETSSQRSNDEPNKVTADETFNEVRNDVKNYLITGLEPDYEPVGLMLDKPQEAFVKN